MPPKYVNVRRVMLKHKRGSKCPFLERFLNEAIGCEEQKFLSSEEIFKEYSRLVALWTEGDSENGQTKYLMKKETFFRVSKRFKLLSSTLEALLMYQNVFNSGSKS